jgi:hypothetical protein
MRKLIFSDRFVLTLQQLNAYNLSSSLDQNDIFPYATKQNLQIRFVIVLLVDILDRVSSLLFFR